MLPREGTKGTNKIWVLCLLCLLVVGVVGCRSRWWSGEIRITPEIEPYPPRVGRATITMRVTLAEKLVAGAQLHLEANMSHAGMAPVFAEAREIEAGRYRAQMELAMAGDWIVSVHMTLANGRKIEQQFEIKGVAPA